MSKRQNRNQRQQSQRKSSATSFGVNNNTVNQHVFSPVVGRRESSNGINWSWGDANTLPYALAVMSQKSIAHRRLINDKSDYISGTGFSCEENIQKLTDFINNANGDRQELRSVFNRIAFDKVLFGNAFLEVVTDASHSFLSLYHQDASRCRISCDNQVVILHHNWTAYSKTDSKEVGLYPNFTDHEDGTKRSIIHYKDYEPMFTHYGLPSYIAGLKVAAIAFKTDTWNVSRLDNSYQLSGIMQLDVNTDTDEEVQQIKREAEKKFSGKPGQVLFMLKSSSDGSDGSKFIPISSDNEGDWSVLHDQAIADIVVAHSWFKTLSGLDYSTGFSSDRILLEYEVALNTIIIPEQQELLEPIRIVLNQILGVDATSLQIINKPPITVKPDYMRVWEARKLDGLDYDEQDEAQKIFLSQL